MKTVKKDSIVKIQYRGTLDNDDTFDMCDDTDPVEFELGSGIMIQAFEDEIIGMEINEKKKFVIPYEKAYGPLLKDTVKTFLKSEFENDSDLKPGDIVAVELDGKEKTPATIILVDDESIAIDMNHPLSGKNLNFEVEILEILDSADVVAFLQ